MPVSLVCSIGWLTREPQLTLHFNGCASSTATLPEMQNPSPANDRQCRSLEFLNDFFVPSLSSLGTFTLHLEARPDPGTRIYTYVYIPTLVSSSCRFTANRCVCTQLRVVQRRRLSSRVHPTVHTWKPSIRTCGRNCGTAAHPVGCVGCVRDYVRTSLIFNPKHG